MADRPIVFVLPALVGGGAERVVLSVADRIAGSGQAVEVISLLDPRERSGCTRAGVPITALGAARVRSAALPLVRRLRAREPAAVLTTLHHVSAMVALLRPWLPPHRHVARVANTYSKELTAFTPWRGALQHRLLRISHRRIDHFICVSAGARDDLLETTGVDAERCTVVKNPVDVDWLVEQAGEEPAVALRPTVVDARFRFISVGRLEAQKDHRTLLTAFATLPPSLDAALVIVGAGSLSGELHEQARGLGIADRVQQTGFVANPYPLFRQCDALVLSSRFEGMPNVLLEALALGLPCVSTNCPSGPAEVLVDDALGVLVPVGDPHALAEGMAEVARRPYDRSLAVRHVRAAHSPASVASQYMDVLVDHG